MNRNLKRLLAFSCFIAVLACSLLAVARPGGGHAYSGGHSSGSSSYHSSGSSSYHSGGGSSGGGGSGSGLILQLILLCFEYPAVGVPAFILIVLFFVGKAVFGSKMAGWSTTSPEAVQAVESVTASSAVSRGELARIAELDPGFSLVLFEDFAYLLYAAVQRARATGTGPIAVYLSPALAQSLTDQSLADVQGVIIGALRYVSFSGITGATISIEVELESNYVEVAKTGQQRRFYAVDRMVLSRASTARSRPFARAHTLDCPNCGAPLEAVRGTQCSYCQQNVGFGRFDWMVQSLSNVTRETRGPLLTSDVAETGTDLPSLVDQGAQERFAELLQRDPASTWQALEGRLGLIFSELQVAWSQREALRIRPFVSDNLFQSMCYWIDLYTQSHCRNVTENARILRIVLANVTTDAHYDAITVRLFATGLDYTISDDGKLLSGNRSRPRTYSEYWTIIRGSSRRAAPRQDASCPHCGAPLRIGMAGQCEYCRVKVTSGEFDWVLSRIEQDDSYGG